jgi:hypothetical protein
MSPRHRKEKTCDMDAQEPQDSELEKELDNLYQKAAGLDQPEDKQSRTAVQSDGKTAAATDIQKPTEIQSEQKKRRRFHTSRIGWGLAFALLALGIIGFFYWTRAYDYGTLHFKGTATPLKTDRLTGETRYPDGEKQPQPPVETVIPAPSAEGSKDHGFATPPIEQPKDQAAVPPPPEESKNQALATPPIEKKRKVHKAPPAATTPPRGRQKRYAIQLRAYAEDQKENAMAYLEDLRKRAPDVSMETVFIAERGVWHRILLGTFATRKEAANYQKSDRLAREYPESFIQRKFESGP